MATNVFHFLGYSCSQPIVTVESDDAKTFGVGNRSSLIAFVTATISLARSRAAQSSIFGAQTDLIGATLVFTVRIFVSLKSSFSCLMKKTAAYALVEAWQNTWNYKSDFFSGLRTFRWTLIFSRSFSCARSRRYCCRIGSDKGWSQLSLTIHKSWTKDLCWIVVSDSQPSGSNNFDTSERICRLLNGVPLSILLWNQIDLDFDSTLFQAL